jgi:hypothetical protein
MKIRSLSRLSLPIVVAACVCGCSPSPSPEAAAREAFRREVEGESQGNIKVVSFVKTDGQSANTFGIESREIDFNAEIEIMRRGTWLSGGWPGRLAYNFTTNFQTSSTATMSLLESVDAPMLVHHGDQIQIKGTMSGTKKDSGWQFETTQSSLTPYSAALWRR